jgi:hypothetical protein
MSPWTGLYVMEIRPGRFTPRGKNSLYPFDMRLDAPQSWFVRHGEWKIPNSYFGLQLRHLLRPTRSQALYGSSQYIYCKFINFSFITSQLELRYTNGIIIIINKIMQIVLVSILLFTILPFNRPLDHWINMKIIQSRIQMNWIIIVIFRYFTCYIQYTI